MESPQPIASGRFEIGGAGRPLVLGEVSGDAWDTLFEGECLTVVLVDGVGHGKLANAAAVSASSCVRNILEHKPMSSLDSVMRSCDAALRGTRGAALGICRFNPSTSSVSY